MYFIMFISFARAKETNQRKLAGCSHRPPTLGSIAQPKELVHKIVVKTGD